MAITDEKKKKEKEKEKKKNLIVVVDPDSRFFIVNIMNTDLLSQGAKWSGISLITTEILIARSALA